MSKDYYKTLGVSENASADDIKKSFRKLAMKYHPDRNKADKAAENRFKEISEAYDILSDQKKRQQYDTMRKYGAFAGSGGFNPNQAGGFDFSGFGNGGSFRAEDLGFGSFADIFSSIFGGEDIFSRAGRTGAGRRSRMAPRKGSDLVLTLGISFNESIKGTTKTIALNKPTACTVCNGSGSAAGTGQTVCPQCAGRGTVNFAQGAFAVSRPCPRCLGRRVINVQPCTACNGTGNTKERKKIKVTIPVGIDTGGKIRLRGMGNPGSNGGPYGDLIITVDVKKSQQFDREGNDVFTKVFISYPDAVLGGKVPVKTLTKEIKITIPPGTKPGTKLRLKGMGLAVNGRKGDQYVEVHIDVPEKVTDRQRELLEELQKTLK
jgi:molecular chaperone DnaJ